MRKEFYKYLNNLFKENPKIAILLGDIGVFSFRDSFKYDSSRIYNMGILEQTMIGVSGGLSDQGFIPFVHSIAPFVSERCYEQLKLDLGYESKNVFVVSVGNSYDYAALGSTHHCPNDLKIINSIPNFKVYCPGNQRDINKIISETININQPKYIRLSEFKNNLDEVCGDYDDLEILQTKKGGLTIIVGNAIKDYNLLLNANINSTILYTCNISDFNTEKIGEIIRLLNIDKNICIVEPSAESGILTQICLNLSNINKIHSISVPKSFINKYGSKKELDEYLFLDDSSIIRRLKEIF